MRKVIVAFSLGLMVFFHAPQAQALSCLPVDMYLEGVVGDDTTQVFVGTASKVKNHTQVVTVSKALQGWVAPKVWVEHPYSNDWQYFCSNGPAAEGKTTIFLTTIDQYGTRVVTQTLAADSEAGKDLVAMIEKKKVDAGITEVTSADRAVELRQSIVDLIKVLMNMLQEMRYWQSEGSK